ncbi:MAG: hypothetical protein V1770_02550 [bacterium]
MMSYEIKQDLEKFLSAGIAGGVLAFIVLRYCIVGVVHPCIAFFIIGCNVVYFLVKFIKAVGRTVVLISILCGVLCFVFVELTLSLIIIWFVLMAELIFVARVC